MIPLQSNLPTKGVTMQLFLVAVPIILRKFSEAREHQFSQIIPGIICQSLSTSHLHYSIVRKGQAFKPRGKPL